MLNSNIFLTGDRHIPRRHRDQDVQELRLLPRERGHPLTLQPDDFVPRSSRPPSAAYRAYLLGS